VDNLDFWLSLEDEKSRRKIMGGFVMELWAFMRERKKFWLMPILLVLLLFGTLIVLTQGSAVAPFIYTLF
jgi:drug/metabolite transporter superfamily protein YnfA